MSNLVKVKDVIERVNTKEDRFNTDRLYYVGGEHFQSRALTVDDRGIIKGSTIGPMFYYGFKSNDFLLVSRNPHLRKAGLVNFDGICSEKTFVLHTKDERILLQKFMPFIFQNERFWKYAIANKHGSTNFFVNWSTLADYSFELPSIEQQKAISKLLWALNDTKKAYEDLIQKTDELVKSQFIEMFGDPVINDRGWPTKSLKEVAPEYSPMLPEADLYWWLNLDMIETYSGRLLEKVMATPEEIGNSTSTFDESMVLYSKLRPYLNKVFVPDDRGYATTELVGMKPDSKILNKYFLFNLLRGDQFVAYANGLSSGGQMPRIPMKALRDFKCILPPIDLQEQFVETSKQSDKSKFELNEAIKDLDAMYKRIIKDNLG